MAQSSQGNYSLLPTTFPVKRKRGRPRKDDSIRSRQPRDYQQPRVNPAPSSSNSLVGQQVSGVLSGTFAGGYLLSVQVANTGSILHGLVFEPSMYSKVTEQNDLAPLLTMSGRRQTAETMSRMVQSMTWAPVTTSTHPVANNVMSVQPLQSVEPANFPRGHPGSTRQGMANDAINATQVIINSSEAGPRPENSNSVPQEPKNAEQKGSQPRTVQIPIEEVALVGPKEAPPVAIQSLEDQTMVENAAGRGNALKRLPGNVNRTEQSIENLVANKSAGGTEASIVQEPQHPSREAESQDGSKSQVGGLITTDPYPDAPQALPPQADAETVQICQIISAFLAAARVLASQGHVEMLQIGQINPVSPVSAQALASNPTAATTLQAPGVRGERGQVQVDVRGPSKLQMGQATPARQSKLQMGQATPARQSKLQMGRATPATPVAHPETPRPNPEILKNGENYIINENGAASSQAWISQAGENVTQKDIIEAENLNTQAASPKGEKFKLLDECLKELNAMDCVDDTLYVKALIMFKEDYNRHVFLSTTGKRRLIWLRATAKNISLQ